MRKEVDKSKNDVIKETVATYQKKEKSLKEEIRKLKEEKEEAEQESNTLKSKEKALIEKEKILNELQERVEKAEQAKLSLEKQIKTSSDPEMTRFKFLFEQWQNVTENVINQKNKLSSEQQLKVMKAIRKVVEVYGL